MTSWDRDRHIGMKIMTSWDRHLERGGHLGMTVMTSWDRQLEIDIMLTTTFKLECIYRILTLCAMCCASVQ